MVSAIRMERTRRRIEVQDRRLEMERRTATETPPAPETETEAAPQPLRTATPTMRTARDTRDRVHAGTAHLRHQLQGMIPPEPPQPTANGPMGLGGLPPMTEEQLREFERTSAVLTLEQNFDLFDNPSGGRTDGIVSRGDLTRFAEGDYDEEKIRERLGERGVQGAAADATLTRMAEAATTILEDDTLLGELDVAHRGGNGDNKISRQDLNAHIRSQEGLGEMRRSQALGTIDEFFPVFDNPGRGGRSGTDGEVSQGDLQRIASGRYDVEGARETLRGRGLSDPAIDQTLVRLENSAQWLLDDDELRGQLDGKFERADLQDLIRERSAEQPPMIGMGTGLGGAILGSAEMRDSESEYMVPNDETHLVPTDESNRDPLLRLEQEGLIQGSLQNGEMVTFTNAEGHTETLGVERIDSDNRGSTYELRTERGDLLTIHSELSARDTDRALANIADYYTQVPEHLRGAVETIDLRSDLNGDVLAHYERDNQKVVFFGGVGRVTEHVFDHEFGHAIGQFEGGAPLVPEGWAEAIESDQRQVSGYAGENEREDFAESWTAYVEARETSPEALEAFQEAFPARFVLLEEAYA